MSLCFATSMITDTKAELEGVWVDYEEGSALLLARHNNEEAQKIRVKGYQKHRALIDAGGDKADAFANEIEAEALGTAVLKGWKGFTNADGSEDEYTAEKASAYITQSKDFRADVQRLSISRDRYLVQSIEADTKKVKK